MIGNMRDRVTIQQEGMTSDGQGGHENTWQDVDTVWAMVDPLRSYERMAQGQQEGATKYRVTIRYVPNLTNANAILWDGKRMNITGLFNPDRKKKYLQIECEEGVAV